ncbi:MAG: hypothetical protein L0216_13505, partial [Planctomycetales bacterium]|nr:hypothetical protein [Planctomycetales bacterium]
MRSLLPLLAAALLAACGTPPPVKEREVWEGNQGLREEAVRALEPTAPVLRIELQGETFRVEDLILGKSVMVRVPSGDPQGRRIRFQG